MRLIEEGDIVTVYMGGEQLVNVVVLHTPSDVGDLWYFRDGEGNVTAVNPSASIFECISKGKKP